MRQFFVPHGTGKTAALKPLAEERRTIAIFPHRSRIFSLRATPDPIWKPPSPGQLGLHCRQNSTCHSGGYDQSLSRIQQPHASSSEKEKIAGHHNRSSPLRQGSWVALRLRCTAGDPAQESWKGLPVSSMPQASRLSGTRRLLQRIRSLVIPPAWADVWICTDSRGHLQATGRDARGRKQSRYHPRWRMARDETKYERMLLFGTSLRGIRARLEEDLALPGLPQNKVLATIVRLMERTLIRVGNEEYARANKSYGLTTMCARSIAQVSGATIVFHFRGKSGKQ